jgi:superfamily II DNA/RNA helicase
MMVPNIDTGSQGTIIPQHMTHQINPTAADSATAMPMDFSELGLGPELLRAVAESGYTKPTPIQEQAIPVVLMGRDVLGCAQTGTGKTASFTLPMIEILAAGRAKARMPRSLILCPTRELAAQVADNFDKYGKYHKLNKALIIGGESMNDQLSLLDRGVDVLIATPGRLLDMFDRGRILLNDVKVLVIDEADRMLDMGFIPDVERIVSMLPKIRQTLFFSATLGPEIKRLADAFLMNPKEISVSTPSSTATTVEQFLAIVDEIDKRETLRHIIRVENIKNAFIFCNRKRDVDVLFRSLKKHDFAVVQLHGDMSQPARAEALGKFKSGDAKLLVCSDVAARGLDIKAVSHVFNFDCPTHSEDYVHRIGRTGRAGEAGRAFTIATPDDGKFIAGIEKLIGKPVPRLDIEGVPMLELDMDARKRGRGRGKDERGAKEEREPRRPRRDEAKAERKAEPERKADIAEPPRREEVQVQPSPQPQPQPQPRREEVRREEQPRSVDRNRDGGRDGGRRDEGRTRSDRGRRDDRGRRRGRIDELGIGEMLHADDVIGFGDHMPDFMQRSVPTPVPSRDVPDEDLDGEEE